MTAVTATAAIFMACDILPEGRPWCKDGMLLSPGDSCRELTDTGEARLRVRSDGALCVRYRPDDWPDVPADPERCTADRFQAAANATIYAGLGAEATSDSSWTIRK